MKTNINENQDDKMYILTPWGCLSLILEDYNVDISHITPKIGKHMVDDFMEIMVKTGYVEKVGDNKS